MFIHLSLHESKAKVLGMPSPELKKKKNYFMLSNNKFLGKCWYGGHPWRRVAMACESLGGGGINYILCLGTTYDIFSMESVGNYSVIFVDRKGMPPKMFYPYLFCFELWHLYKSLLPSVKGLSFTLCNFYFYLCRHLLL